MKRCLFVCGTSLFFLLLLASVTNAATYYVSVADGDDTNCTGLSQDAYTSGSEQPCPWQTISKINASTFQPGDSILFKKGEVWRGGKLTMPSSGTAGNVITFSAYGSGDNPLINGSALLNNASFSPYVIAGPSIFSVTPTLNVNDGARKNYRQVISSVSQSATHIKIRLTAADSADWVIVGTSIGPQVSGATSSAMTRITWDGGSNGTTITAGTYKDSDEITFSMTTGQAYLVHIYMSARNYKYAGGSTFYYDSNAVDETLVTAPTGSQLNFSTGGNTVTAIFGDDATIYSISQATNPVFVWENSVPLTSRNSTSSATAANSWYWDGAGSPATLYVNASDSSNVVTNGKIYEAGDQIYGIFDNGKNYLDVSHLDSTKTYGSVDSSAISGVYLTGSHNTFHDMEVSYTGRHNFCFYTGSDNNVAYNLTLHDDYTTTPVCIYGTGTTANTLRNSNIYQSQAVSTTAGPIILHGTASSNIVEYNEIHIDNAAPRSTIIAYDVNTNSNIIRYNHIYGNGQIGISAIGTTGALSNWQIYGNLIDAQNFTSYPISLTQNNLDDWQVVNNTIISNSLTTASVYLTTVINTLLKNNVVYNRYFVSVPVSAQSGFVSNNNLFYHPTSQKWTWGVTDYSSLSTWQAASSQDANSTSTDPLFVNASSDFHLTALSPAIDAATTTSITLTTDYAGNPIYGTPDLGAYEYQPPFTIGTDDLDATGNIRLYYDGKYRYLTATSSTMSVDLGVLPAGGTLYTYAASTTRPEWLDISSITWSDSTKSWTVSSSVATTTIFTVGDLTASSPYLAKLDGASSASFTGPECTGGVCVPAGTSLTLTYTGDYATSHTFSVTQSTYANQVTDLAVTNTTTNSAYSVSLNWTNASQTGVKIEQDTGCDASYETTELDSPSSNPSLPRSVTVTANTCYQFRVSSYNADGVLNTTSIPTTAQITTPPAQPGSLTAQSSTDTSITWDWADVTAATGYKVYNSTNDALLTTIASATSNWSQTLAPNTQSSVYVRATNANGEGIKSSSASAYSSASAPSSPGHSTNTTSSITWTWTPGTSQKDFYAWTETPAANSGWITDQSWAQGSLSANTAYTFYVKARNDATPAVETSAVSATAYTSQNTPTGVTFGTVTANSVTLSAAGTLPNLTSGSSGLYFLNTTNSANSDWTTTNSWANSSLTPNTEYTYQVRARNGDSEATSYSATSATTTLAAVPATLALTADSTTQVTASWGANSNPTGTEYYVENTTASTNSGWITDTSWASTGLTCGTTYSFRVKARNSASVETDFTESTSQATTACANTTPTPTVSPSFGSVARSRQPAAPTLASLQALLVTLQAQLATLTGQSNPVAPSSFIFTKPLRFGETNSDVRQLQIFLNTHGFPIAATGVGSLGHETNYFGDKTLQALGRFQLANHLVSSSHDIPYGYLGPKTRELINGLK